MAKFFASFHLLLVLVLLTSVRTSIPRVNGELCRIAAIDGGCPDECECMATCSTCGRDAAGMESYCQTIPGTPVVECVCSIEAGADAPCIPRGEPKCPNWPRPPTSFTENNTTV